MKTMLMIMIAGLGLSGAARADNPLTADQLVKSIQVSLTDQARNDGSMFKSISGLRTTTTATNATVAIDMKSDGMNMSVKYLCVPQGQDMACRIQQ